MNTGKERARFEAWALSEGLNPIFTERTGYTTYTEHCAWRGWQAARSGLPDVEQIENWLNENCGNIHIYDVRATAKLMRRMLDEGVK